jgi:hypothetical protein
MDYMDIMDIMDIMGSDRNLYSGRKSASILLGFINQSLLIFFYFLF